MATVTTPTKAGRQSNRDARITAPRLSPTPIAAPRLRPARLPAGRSVVGTSAASSGAGSSAATCTCSPDSRGAGAGRSPTIGTGPVSPPREPWRARGAVSPLPRAPRGNRSVPRSDDPGRSAAGGGVIGGEPSGSDLEQLGLLVLHRVVDAVGVLGGQVVELLLGTTDVVLARLAVLDEAVELLLRPTADVADGDLRVLALGPGHLHQVATTLLGELGEDDPEDRA